MITTAIILVGCDNTIEPFAEKGAYSVYEYLSLTRADQLLRVKPLPVPITKVGSSPLGATVTLENLDTGTSVRLKDSLIVLQDANARLFTHSFWADLPITARTKYRLTVDGLANLDLPELHPDRQPRCWEANPCAGLKTTQMEIWYQYLGPEWYGDIPKDSLTYDPLESHDVANGLGFFGSVNQDWVPFTAKKVPKFYFTGARGCQRPPDS